MAYYYGGGAHQNPAMKYEMQDTSVPMQQTTTHMTVVRDRPKWSWCSTVWSSITLWLCCPLFGFIGLVCGVLAYSDHKSGDFDRADRKRKCSWGWGMSGFALGIIFLIAIIVMYAVFWNEIVDNSNTNIYSG